MWNQIMYEIVTTLTPILAAALIGLVGVAIRHVTAMTKNIKNPVLHGDIQEALYQIDNIVRSVVISLQQTVVKPAKEAGKWDASVAQQVKQQALQEVQRLIPAETKAFVKRSIPDLEALLSNIIEENVYHVS
jgi:uncharacterized circularly permuted ATP-grasp superfamily protein